MAHTLKQIAEQLRDANKKVQLIYAFNGTGKTRLSREFKELIAPKNAEIAEGDDGRKPKVMYYNAFTEDLFYWNNDLEYDTDRRLIIQPNGYTEWVLVEQGQAPNITANFQHYTNDKLTPHFNEGYSEVRFSFERGDDSGSEYIKISKGEESCFIWSVFYSLLEQTISVLNVAEEADRETDQFNDLQYVFIDDPVSSLDDNHLIELAVNIAELIKSSQNENLKFIVTTHNPIFYNVLYSELQVNEGNLLSKKDDGSFLIIPKKGDSNTSFSYHLFLKQTIQEAIDNNVIQKYHFVLLRNLYEKTASFLGYPRWKELLPDDKQTYYNRIIQFTSHSLVSTATIAEPTDPEKQTLKLLLNHLVDNNYWKKPQDATV